MAQNPNSPLNDEHLRQINAALDAAKIAESQIILAKQAGIDVQTHEDALKEHLKRLHAIKHTYFPGSY